VSNQGDSSPSATTTVVPNTGPFTGTFTADFGPELDRAGQPVEGAPPPYQETWRLRSVCGASGCVATAATGGQFPATLVVFDDIGARWLAVAVSSAKCKNLDSEWWDVVSLQPRPDGTMSGEWITTNSQACYDKRTVTFTRTGDTDIGSLTDPASQPPRMVSPAEALHGRYHSEMIDPSGAKEEYDLSVRTDCLRTGERCLSYFLTSIGEYPSVFGNGKWTLIWEYDASCASGGASHVRKSAEFPLPHPPQDPITLLAGQGRDEEAGACTLASPVYDQKFVRTGD
jgi:hypothetical protein